FPVSAYWARESYKAEEQQEVIRLWRSSRLEALEDYLFRKLDNAERVRLKLLSQLGVMQTILLEAQKGVDERDRLLDEDKTTVDTIQSKFQTYRGSMERDFRFRLSEIQ